MTLNWERYVTSFRRLIIDGWRIFKQKGCSTYWWVYPDATLIRRYTMREANEITSFVDSIGSLYGTTRTVNYSCSLYREQGV